MKQKYTYTVAGQALTFISDEEKAFVDSVVEQTDREVTGIMMANLRCARLDAALIAALDFCSEKMKAERKVKNLEAQISLYEAAIARMKSAEAKDSASVSAEPEAKNDESAANDSAKEEAHPSETAGRSRDKISELEDMLKQRRAEKKEETKQLKLDQIESLLRK